MKNKPHTDKRLPSINGIYYDRTVVELPNGNWANVIEYTVILAFVHITNYMN